MLPTAGPLPTGPGWAHEFKWDGIRAMCGSRAGSLRMQTRRGNDVSAQFPEIGGTAVDAILDGEIVVFTDESPDFGATLRRLRAKLPSALVETVPATMLAFDLLHLDGADLRGRPYEERRAALEGLTLPPGWVVPPAFSDGPATLAASIEHGLEGVVAKRLVSRYVSRRSRDWIKHRHQGAVDAVVIGWRRTSSGGISILLAEPGPGGLVHTGRCTAPRSLLEVLEPLAVTTPPVVVAAAPIGVQWVRPELRVEVVAGSRSPGGRLRHPRFVRARLDQLG
jgi:bifunctional non-homologous end joining protein LigD